MLPYFLDSETHFSHFKISEIGAFLTFHGILRIDVKKLYCVTKREENLTVHGTVNTKTASKKIRKEFLYTSVVKNVTCDKV